MADRTPLSICGLDLDGGTDTDDIATAAVVVVEMISADTSKPYLRLMSSDLPVWQRIGILRCVLASDEASAVDAFEADDD